MGRRLLIAAAAALPASYAVSRSGRGSRLDRTAGAALARPLGPGADMVIALATDAGSLYAVAGGAAALAATGRRGAAADVLGAGLVAWAAAQIAKGAAERPRPYQAGSAARLVAEPAGSSWPSGHTAVAGAVAAELAPRLGLPGRAAAAVTAGFVALSRVYVGVHYLSDVVAGLAIGAWSAWVWRLVRRLGSV